MLGGGVTYELGHGLDVGANYHLVLEPGEEGKTYDGHEARRAARVAPDQTRAGAEVFYLTALENGYTGGRLFGRQNFGKFFGAADVIGHFFRKQHQRPGLRDHRDPHGRHGAREGLQRRRVGPRRHDPLHGADVRPHGEARLQRVLPRPGGPVMNRTLPDPVSSPRSPRPAAARRRVRPVSRQRRPPTPPRPRAGRRLPALDPPRAGHRLHRLPRRRSTRPRR